MSVSVLSNLEQRRLENIQRNEEYLLTIGIQQRLSPQPSERRPRKAAKRVRSAEEEEEAAAAWAHLPLRRSSRVASQEPVSYAEVRTQFPAPDISSAPMSPAALVSLQEQLGGRSSEVSGDVAVGAAVGVDALALSMAAEREQKAEGREGKEGKEVAKGAGAGFASDLHAHVDFFLGSGGSGGSGGAEQQGGQGQGRDVKVKREKRAKEEVEGQEGQAGQGGGLLCEPLSVFGKAAVMQSSNFGVLPRFNKYCGALEWKNCVYLWVNIGGGSGYRNAFSEGGRHMMWYGGSKMHEAPIS
ncbi:hypothetical protein B484DRAFT_407186 [Ochromonadaceae sp. CCMP2298]|nr:hypothetical protein B484DRAFT_407186 [Ochromonadaceae sp. CCMP2298]